jgi:hypothetical protein
MADEHPPSASEVVFLPRPSWAPAVLAVGLAVALAGAFAGWFYAALGGLIALIGLWIWIKQSAAETAQLPADQAVDTAVLPPVNVRRANGR